MNIWLSENFYDNKKTKRLIKDLGSDAVISLHKLWIYAGKYAVDNLLNEEMIGILKDFDEVDVEMIAEWEKEEGSFFKKILELKLLEKRKGQYFIHDFADNQPYIVDLIKKKINGSVYAKKRWEAKKNSCLLGDPIDTQRDTQWEGNNTKDNDTKDNNKNIVGKSKNQSEKKSVKTKIPYSEIIDYLNEITKHRYTVTKKYRGLIKARFNGKAKEDFFMVIDFKNKEWGNNPEMSHCLRPETLFGTKFDTYLAQARKEALKEDDPEYDPFALTEEEQEERKNRNPFYREDLAKKKRKMDNKAKGA